MFGHARPHVRHRVAKRLVYVALSGGALLFGCQFIVPGEVPEFRCTTADTAACPTGMVCNPVSFLCVSPSSLPEGSTVDGEPPDNPDGGDANRSETGSGLQDLGQDCVVDGDCKAGLFCGTSTVLTTSIVPVNSKPICTKPCCTSDECKEGFFCYGAATGGNYCVPGTRLGREPASGASAKTAGTPCGNSSECRSGLCVGRCENIPNLVCTGPSQCDGGPCTLRCNDTCCENATCATGSTCRIESINQHVIWACGAPNTPANDFGIDRLCVGSTDCKNDNCVGFPKRRCTPPCCKSADCTTLGFPGFACAYGAFGSDQRKWCFDPNDAGAPLGASCNLATDCLSRYCDPALQKCAAACCADDDCPEGETCRPSPVGTPFLRCVSSR
jgi:hypothetical protein